MHHKLSHYKCAASLLQTVKDTGVNVKHILYNEKKYKYMNVKSLFALVSEALKNWNIIDFLINESKILINEPSFNIWHVRIIITELIFGKKVIDDQNKFGHTILQYESKFRQLLSKQEIQESVPINKNVEIKVRYIKVNPLKESVDCVINIFIEEGWQQIATPDNYQEFLDQLRSLEPHSDFFLQDFHIPEVLVFPPGTELHSHTLYKNGSIFFMDKSSCLAPYVLQPREDSSLLDMCAAPGLKTIQLASLVQSGKVYAVEKDAGRFQSLKDMVELCGADNIIPIHEDVTKLKLDQYADVEFILLDPSCSGSGMRWRQPLVKEDKESCNKSRLHKLAGFQLTLLRFALTRFPSAKRIVYSTCSLNEEENEEVVKAALNSKFHDFKLVSAGKKLSQWINFGSEKYSFGPKCIYSRPEIDLTNGFFVAVFKRRKFHLSKELHQFSVNSSDDCNSDVKTKNKISKNVDFNDTYNDIKINKPLPSITRTKYDHGHKSDYSIKDKHSNTTYYKHDAAMTKKSQSKERLHKTTVDQISEFCPPKEINKGNKNDVYDRILTNNEDQKSINTTKTQLTTSGKKRMRQRKRKLDLIKNSDNKKDKKKKVKVKNINCCSKSNIQIEKIKNNNTLQKTKKPNEQINKISKAKLRYQRLKKLNAFKKLSCSSFNETAENANLELSNSGKDTVPNSQVYKQVGMNIDASGDGTAVESQYSKNKGNLKNIEPMSYKEEKIEKKKKKVIVPENVSLTEQMTSVNNDIFHNKKHKKNLHFVTDSENKINQRDVRDTFELQTSETKSVIAHFASTENLQISKKTKSNKKLNISTNTESICFQDTESHEIEHSKHENIVTSEEETHSNKKRDKDKHHSKKRKKADEYSCSEKSEYNHPNINSLQNDMVVEHVSTKKHKRKKLDKDLVSENLS